METHLGVRPEVDGFVVLGEKLAEEGFTGLPASPGYDPRSLGGIQVAGVYGGVQTFCTDDELIDQAGRVEAEIRDIGGGRKGW